MKSLFIIILIMACSQLVRAQETKPDSAQTLEEVIVKAFEQSTRLRNLPAAIGLISNKQLNRFTNTTLIPAMNMIPGVRMEERSPGSYRLNIRGSSLRSPFGVRNVKVYYNNIPYTDPGGNTYLNQLGFYNIQSVEVIKGPGSSLYGAGTGGVILLNTQNDNWHPGLSFDYSAGHWSLNNLNTNLRLGTDAFQNAINYQQLSSHGYRDHAELDRKVFSWDLHANLSDRGRITTHFLWSDLFYQTPGALTLNEYITNPKAARPRVGATPGSAENKAAIYSRIFLAGISFNQKFSDNWENTTSFYGASTRLLNPSIRNYGRTNEPHTGGRSFFKFSKPFGSGNRISLVTGIEFQQGISSVRIYSNKNGNPDTLQADDEINNRLFFGFAQATLELKGNWVITGGASVNAQKITITRLSAIPVIEKTRRYNNELAPRMAVLKQISKNLSVYTAVSRGFSPPTTAELLPSSGIIATDLDAEDGINYELGVRGNLGNRKIYYDINAFWFGLKNTIVQRRDAGGADFFVNAGSTRQRGIESFVSWQPSLPEKAGVPGLRFWISHTWHHFRYHEFKQVNSDYSNNRLPSVAPHVLAAGADIESRQGIYLNINYYYSDVIPLNDANSANASAFHLLGARTGWKKSLHSHVLMELFLAADNILDRQYSLGNDINGFGGRYYNAASAFNIAVGIRLHFQFRQ